MKTHEQLRELLDQVRYKPTWALHFGVNGERPYLQWSFVGPCANTGIPAVQPGRKWFLSGHMTDGEVVQTAFAAALQAEEHECREFFMYAGKRIMNPHLNLAAMMMCADMTEGRA